MKLKRKWVARYKSSRGVDWYDVWLDETGRAICSCPGWLYQQKCWHTEKETEKILERGYKITWRMTCTS